MPLSDFGFTRTQQLVYEALLKRGAATGYVIARDTRVARANVYQALDVLVSRGMAKVSAGRPATYQAVDASDAVSKLRADCEISLGSLAAELGVADSPGPEQREPSKRDADDLLAIAVSTVDDAAHEVLAVVGPWVAEVSAAIDRARARGVTCRVVSLGAPAPEGAVLKAVTTSELAPYWGGLPVVLVCDRNRAVCCVLPGDRNGRAEGLVTTNPGVVPFLRHLLRREFATAAAPH